MESYVSDLYNLIFKLSITDTCARASSNSLMIMHHLQWPHASLKSRLGHYVDRCVYVLRMMTFAASDIRGLS